MVPKPTHLTVDRPGISGFLNVLTTAEQGLGARESKVSGRVANLSERLKSLLAMVGRDTVLLVGPGCLDGVP